MNHGLDAMRQDLADSLFGMDEQVSVSLSETNSIRGQIKGVDSIGRLVIEDEKGDTTNLAAGEIIGHIDYPNTTP